MTAPRRFRPARFFRRWWPALLALGTTVALLNFTYFWLDDAVRGVAGSPWPILVEELTAGFGAALSLTGVIWLALRWRLDERGWGGRLPRHAAGMLLFSVARTTWNWGTRSALFPLLGLGSYDYGAMPLRYLMELPSDVLLYAVAVTLTYLVDRVHRARDQELALSRLEARLAEARLGALRAQLRPHFLFNTLNAVSSVMYEDVERADEMLAKLGTLLRRTMEGEDRSPRITLGEELSLADLYVELMRLRFGGRLELDVDVPSDLHGVRVPRFVLQPLLENAIHHGAPAPPETARVRVVARRTEREVLLAVEDNGPGFGPTPHPATGRRLSGGDADGTLGIGLRTTGSLIEEIYGEGSGLSVEESEWGGARVALRLPHDGDRTFR